MALETKQQSGKKFNIKIALFVIIAILFVVATAFFSTSYIEFAPYNEHEVIEYPQNVLSSQPQGHLKNELFAFIDIPLKTTADTKINFSELGLNTVKYTADFLFIKNTASQTIEIVDTTKPIIQFAEDSLTGGQISYIAYDNYDGDITDQVETEIKNGIEFFTITDSSGNTAVEAKVVDISQVPKPIITVNSTNVVRLKLNEEYTPPTFSAADALGEDLTAEVVVEGSVDTSANGRYTIKYTVTDQFGKTTTVKRLVIVGDDTLDTSHIDKNTKVIYLTFDDGPGPYTEILLDVLKKNDVQATFFVVNSKYNHLLQRISEEGHAIGAHTFSHVYSDIYSSKEKYYQDLNNIQSVIKEYTGSETKLIRFPGGSSNTVSKKYCPKIMTELSQELTEQGYAYFDWNVDSGDASFSKTAEDVYNNTISAISKKKQAVVLQHDTKLFSIQAVDDIIKWGKQNGYVFLPLTEESPVVHHSIYN